MQAAIENLSKIGALPNSIGVTVSIVQAFEQQLSEVKTPVSNDEAHALVELFGPDDCFGLAWTLLHLIETAPNWPMVDVLDGREGLWIDRLRERPA